MIQRGGKARPHRARAPIARRRVRSRKPEPKTRWSLLIALALVPLSFWAGLQLVPERIVVKREMRVEEATPCVATSTIGLCPCPKPRKRAQGIPIKRKKVAPVITPLVERGDPTAKTAQYLKENALLFSSCAPQSGVSLRVHLEIQVAPTGVVEHVRIANLEPVPVIVSSCIERTVSDRFDPPGFDAMGVETFALTVVL